MKVNKKLTPSQDIKAMAYDPKGIYLLALSTDGTLFIWDIENEKCIKRFEKIAKKVYSIFNSIFKFKHR